MADEGGRSIAPSQSGWQVWVRRTWYVVLALLIGLGGGVLLMLGVQDDPLLEEERVVLYEAANSGFPVRGGAFSPPFYNESTGRCELDKFKEFMEENPERKEAWKEIRGLSEEDYDSLMDRLQQASVAKHTPVTNHGYRDGRWFPVNSVLAPNTPVMIDPELLRRDPDLRSPEPTVTEDVDSPTPSPTESPPTSPPVEESPGPTEETGTPQPEEEEREKEDFVIVMKCECGNPITDPKCPPNCGEMVPTPQPSPSPSPSPFEETPTRFEETPTPSEETTETPSLTGETPPETEEPTPSPTETPLQRPPP